MENLRKHEKTDKIIEIVGVTKVFDDVTVVDDLSLSIKRGEFVTLLGPSGCGKTTLLRMIAGFETPTSGKIYLEKQDVTDIPPHRRNINTVFQKYALFPHLNVFNNVAYGLKLKKIKCGEKIVRGKTVDVYRHYTKAEIAEKVNKALKMVNLESYGHRDVVSLSGGQQQRVAIARAIVCEPKVLLLDEPLGALDLKMRKEMQLELKAIHRNVGITFVYVTHDQEEALTMSDKIVVVNDGVIQQIGTPKKIYDEPSNAFVADFIGESNILSGLMVKDFKVCFLDTLFDCEDKGFAKNEPVDLVIRPEDITIYRDGVSGQLGGKVVSSVFKGTWYGLQKGDTVNVSVPFDAVELTDDEEDGVIGANVTQILYKGTYYQVQIYTDTDEDFYIDTTDEWDIDDRVGVKVLADKIKVEKTEETEDEEV